jgi:hypothetical protein
MGVTSRANRGDTNTLFFLKPLVVLGLVNVYKYLTKRIMIHVPGTTKVLILYLLGTSSPLPRSPLLPNETSPGIDLLTIL